MLQKILLLLFLSASALAAKTKINPICDKALEAIPKYDSSKKMFHELNSFYKKYNVCMDGAIAEQTASLTVEILNKNWNQISELNSLIKNDNGFKQFILSNIEPNVTAQENEVNQIIVKANKSCPKNMKTLCQKISNACKKSLKPD